LLAALAMPAARAGFTGFDDDHFEMINGVRLHFRVRGTNKMMNPYMVVLSGGPGFSSSMFLPWGTTSGVEEWLNVVYLDQRGSGQSAPLAFANPAAPTAEEAKGYNIATLIADIEGVRKFLKIGPWYVLGHSWGGMLGLEYVVANPDSVRGFIDVDGLVSQPNAQESALTFARTFYEGLQKSATRDSEKTAAAGKLAEVIRMQGLPAGDDRWSGVLSLLQGDPGLFSALYYQHADRSTTYNDMIGEAIKLYSKKLKKDRPPFTLFQPQPEAALRRTEGYTTRDDTALFEKVKVPTLIIHGQQDHLIPLAQAEAARAAIKGANMFVVSDSGHFPFVEQPVKMTQAILAFTIKD